jgi:hypothetical protein
MAHSALPLRKEARAVNECNGSDLMLSSVNV